MEIKRYATVDVEGRLVSFYASHAGTKPPSEAIELTPELYEAWRARTHDQGLVDGRLVPIKSSVRRWMSVRVILQHMLTPEETAALHTWAAASVSNLLWLVEQKQSSTHLTMGEAPDEAHALFEPLITSGVLTRDRVADWVK